MRYVFLPNNCPLDSASSAGYWPFSPTTGDAQRGSFWPFSAAAFVNLRVRYRGHSCRARSLIRRRVRREVADIEHGQADAER